MNRILVIGHEGQLARSLAERGAEAGVAIVTVGRPEFDLTQPSGIAEILDRERPTMVVNAAAYTAVDKAEDEPEAAHAINAVAPGVIAAAARDAGTGFVHVSTDYVFDGAKPAPYVESDPTGPIGVYGATKLEGEARVLESHPDAFVLRTAWVVSPFGKNFVRTMLALAKTRDRLTVVDDQHGCPTSALDLADAILAIAAAPNGTTGGVYHVAGSGEATWRKLAAHALDASRDSGGPWAQVDPIRTEDWPTRAARPRNSRLDCTKFTAAFGWQAPNWRQSVATIVQRLVQEGAAA